MRRRFLCGAAFASILMLTVMLVGAATGADASTVAANRANVASAAQASSTRHMVHIQEQARVLTGSAVPRAVYECVENVTISWSVPKKEIVSSAYFSDCVGSAYCTAQADLQEASPTNPNNWFTIRAGGTDAGCSPGNGSDATAVNCHATSQYYRYRTLGVFYIVWDDGSTSGPFDDYGGAHSLQMAR